MMLYDAVALVSGSINPNDISALGLNNLGDAAGGINFGPGVEWLWNGAKVTLDPLQNAKSAFLWAINDLRVAVGARQKDGEVEQYIPIMVSASPGGAQATDLTALVGNAVCTGINNHGMICGYRVDEGGTSVSGFVIDSDGNKVVAWIPFPPGQSSVFPQSINDAGDVVVVPGFSIQGSPGAYVLRNFTDLIAVSNLVAPVQGAQRMNKLGQIAGFDDGSAKPVVWDTNTTPPTAVSVPLPDGFEYGATTGINDSGVIVGVCWKAFGDADYSFIYDPTIDTTTSSLLGDLITTPGYGQEWPIAINNLGQILIGLGPPVLLTPRQHFPQSVQLSRIVATILFGIIQDGDGLETVGGRGVHVPPNQPPDGWQALSPAARDALIGLALNQIASQIGDAAGRGAVGRAALELTRASVASLQAAPAARARGLGGARPPATWSNRVGARRGRPPGPLK